MSEKVSIILAAGGNPTGVVSFPDASKRQEYPSIAKEFMSSHSAVEQFGFIEGVDHFEMSGGEFCGNAARAAAWLIARKTGKQSGQFTMSGFSDMVSYQIFGDPNGSQVEVECIFPNFQYTIRAPSFLDGHLVDLKGIVHLVLPSTAPFDPNPNAYQTLHRQAVKELGLEKCEAVGVIWQEIQPDKSIKIHPVVWVRGIDSFFYETACGSGTLAVLLANGASRLQVVQPSEDVIKAEKRENETLVLRSSMNEEH